MICRESEMLVVVALAVAFGAEYIHYACPHANDDLPAQSYCTERDSSKNVPRTYAYASLNKTFPFTTGGKH